MGNLAEYAGVCCRRMLCTNLRDDQYLMARLEFKHSALAVAIYALLVGLV
jgi:hypothetical protein